MESERSEVDKIIVKESCAVDWDFYDTVGQMIISISDIVI